MTNRMYFFLICAFLSLGAFLASCSKTEQPSAASQSNSSSPVNVSDRDVNEHVKSALNQNEALKAFDIQVITLKGDVRLIGVVDSQAHIDEALRIARSSDGAHTIHNELTIKK